MQLIINITLTILFLLVLPCLLGVSFERFFIATSVPNCNKVSIARSLVMGIILMLASFQLIAVPMIVIGTSFQSLVYIWLLTILVYATVSAIKNWNYIKELFESALSRIYRYFNSLGNEYIIYFIISILLIIFETCLLIFKTHMDTDDSRFIAESMEAYEKNSLLRINPITGLPIDFPIGEMLKDVTSPYPIFIAVISYLTRVHPAIMAHAILPVLLIPLSYVVSYLISNYLFKEKDQIPVFMLLLAIIVLFSFGSIYSWGYTMLTIIWQGRSIVAVIILPFLWYLLMVLMSSDNIPRGLFLAIFVTALASVDLSGMGGIMAPLVGAAFAITFILIKRRLLPAISICICVAPAGIYEIIYKLLSPSHNSHLSLKPTFAETINTVIKAIINAQRPYASEDMMIALYFVALLVIIFYCKNTAIKQILVLPSSFMLFLLYCAIPTYVSVGGHYQDFFTGRTFWILIMPIITAYGFTLFVCNLPKKKSRLLAITLLFPVFMYCGTFKITNAMYIKPENAYRLPGSTVAITEHVLSEKEAPKLIVPYTIAHPFRQISTDVYLLYGEDASYGRVAKTSTDLIKISDQMVLETPDLNYIVPLAKKNDVDYIVFDTVYTTFCENGDININNYPIDESYVADRTATINFEDLKEISVINDEQGIYWDLSNYGLEYDGTYGQYILYRFL